MTELTTADSYATQSAFTDPGAFAAELDEVPATLQAIKDAVHQLVFHYRAAGDWEAIGTNC